jgi:hypothetical protein
MDPIHIDTNGDNMQQAYGDTKHDIAIETVSSYWSYSSFAMEIKVEHTYQLRPSKWSPLWTINVLYFK